jgi:hypothetical protein
MIELLDLPPTFRSHIVRSLAIYYFTRASTALKRLDGNCRADPFVAIAWFCNSESQLARQLRLTKRVDRAVFSSRRKNVDGAFRIILRE